MGLINMLPIFLFSESSIFCQDPEIGDSNINLPIHSYSPSFKHYYLTAFGHLPCHRMQNIYKYEDIGNNLGK